MKTILAIEAGLGALLIFSIVMVFVTLPRKHQIPHCGNACSLQLQGAVPSEKVGNYESIKNT